jgi:uncharacterized protein YabN with tetrapyrrole methylase and pyrophosphatase domain
MPKNVKSEVKMSMSSEYPDDYYIEEMINKRVLTNDSESKTPLYVVKSTNFGNISDETTQEIS